MRKIKFRAWANGQMLDDISTYTDDFTSMLNKTFAYLQESENVKFMQFTGLKDKNGKEIYEGDLLIDSSATNEDYIPRVIRWDNARGMFVAPFVYPHWAYNYSCIGLNFVLKPYPHDVEVIGNIYENPELLEIK